MSRQKTKALIVDVNKTILKDKVNPIQPVIDYVNTKFDEGYKIFLISGSHSARLRVMRIALARCGVKYHDLTLNEEGILLDAEYKRKYVKKQMQYYDVVQFIDNNEQHRDAVAALGVDVSAPDEIE
jgi:hypothetical protein